MRPLLAIAALAALAAVPAALAGSPSSLARAAAALADDPVYVAVDASPTMGADDADELRDRIRAAGGGVYVAVLGRDALREAGSAERTLAELNRRLRRPGTYAVVAAGAFRAGSTRGDLPRGTAPRLARDAIEAHRDEGVAATLLAFVDAVGLARSGEAAPAGERGGSDGGSDRGSGTGLVVVLGLGAAGVGAYALVKRRRRGDEFRRVREVAEEDLVALGEDVRALDLDVEMPGADPQAKQDYAAALTAYERASEAFRRARRPEELEAVSAALEEGRFAMTAAKARLAGEQPPERRPPCFFDPRHGPSVRDVEWAPPGGEPRPVPACAADAIRIEEGGDPETRLVSVGGERVPYWAAGPAFSPWAGGFFGGVAGGLLPALLIGPALGAAVGGAFADDASAGADAGYEGGDFGGGDFGGGDFGGDFGGGDFGGGDLGGGGGGGDF